MTARTEEPAEPQPAGTEHSPTSRPHSLPRASLRAIATGMLLGGVLSLCNIYSGLKIGFTTNMSITAALSAFALFWSSQRLFRTRPLSLYENATQQTAASAAATIAGSGLVAPIPALTMLTGRTLAYGWLVTWVLNVSLLGVIVGVSLKRALVVREQLPFPYGVATAELLSEMYARGSEALVRAKALLAAVAVAAGTKVAVELLRLVPWAPSVHVRVTQSLTLSANNLGLALDPSLLMVGVGALIGIRAGVSMLLGALIAWGVLAPMLLADGRVVIAPEQRDGLLFQPLSGFLIWPGVSLMVSAALCSFGLSMLAARRTRDTKVDAALPSDAMSEEVSPRVLGYALFVTGVCSVVLQKVLFDVPVYAGTAAVGLSFALALVAGRVAGETGIAPIGAMGKVTQLMFAAINPGNPTSNLMAANVTGGAASQCADMLHDLKAGHVLGVQTRHQALAQVFGVLSGALCGSAGYLLMVPDPKVQLVTSEWPAPAVAQWKAVAEVFSHGFSHLPRGSGEAALIALLLGALLAIAERTLPVRYRAWVPSAASVGLAFVLPAYYALSVFVGALLAYLFQRLSPTQSLRFSTTVASGVIAGESLVGAGFAVARML